MIRTRVVTETLSYDNLVAAGAIPDLVALTQQTPDANVSKRYPPFVYAAKRADSYSFFGMIMDYVVRAGLRINLQQPVELGVDPNAELIQTFPDEHMINALNDLNTYQTSKNMNDIARTSLLLTTLMYNTQAFAQEDIQRYVPTMVNIMKAIVAKWAAFQAYFEGTVKFNTEYSYKEISGHPDIVVIGQNHSCVLDIKNTASFPKMAKEASLQVLAYYALMKTTVPNIRFVGFVLPMQRDVVIYDLGGWDSSAYLKILSDTASRLAAASTTVDAIAIPGDIIPGDIMAQLTLALGNLGLVAEPAPTTTITISVGSHIHKIKPMVKGLQQFADRRPGQPCQMMLRNPRTGRMAVDTPKQVPAAKAFIASSGLQYYTHAAYTINLCADACDVNDGNWAQRSLNEDLQLTAEMGGRGVIVHTGACCGRPLEAALQTMEHMVRTALQYATKSCPLLLETPCGEGTEVCTNIQDLGSFFFRFTPEEREKLGVCIDTAHIWGAGYDNPVEYFKHWEQYCQTPIGLVHFNDSRSQCGDRTDKHAPPGQGYIGMEKMLAVGAWCQERGIPMVHE